MHDLHYWHLVLLAVVGLVAGFVDAIAGGGGLLTLPALLLTGMPTQLALGTNKGQSVFGSGLALVRFYHSGLLDRNRLRVSFLSAGVGAVLGVLVVQRMPSTWLRPIMVVLLTSVALFMLAYKPAKVPLPPRIIPIALAALVIGSVGFYDGFFGPGTGTLLIMAFLLVWRDPLDAASANAKVANFASNIAALAAFALSHSVVWKVALPMAAGQAVGGWMGAHVTVKHGQGLVRTVVVLASLAVVGRLGWQIYSGG